MKALKVITMIDDEGQLNLDHPLVTDRNSRGEVIVLMPEEEFLDAQPQLEVLADFRQAWHEAMTGQTIPVAQMWEGLEVDRC
jgi:hypothetical protein